MREGLEVRATGEVDSWDRPIYMGSDGKRYVDTNLGRGVPDIHNVTSVGEPAFSVQPKLIARRVAQGGGWEAWYKYREGKYSHASGATEDDAVVTVWGLEEKNLVENFGEIVAGYAEDPILGGWTALLFRSGTGKVLTQDSEGFRHESDAADIARQMADEDGAQYVGKVVLDGPKVVTAESRML
jgi:hypothetical protein